MTPRLASTRDYLRHALADCGTLEIRHQLGERWASGWFNNVDQAMRYVDRLRNAGNLYSSLNAPKPRRVSNDMTGSPIRNDDIGWIVRIPFDLDPVRPTGVSSTEAELRDALQRRDGLVATLRKLGWPMPLHGLSGNGYHAVYRCRIPANTETTQMMSVIYSGLASELSDDVVSFDRTVRNPGRIFRLYGTKNRKGPETPDRPHRESACWIPSPWRQVDPRLITTLAEFYARQRNTASDRVGGSRSDFQAVGQGDYRTLDVIAWFTAHGLYRHPVEGRVHAVWCPWRDGHSTPHGRTGAVIFESDGNNWPGFHCHHSSCSGRGIKDVMRRYGDADRYCRAQWQGGKAS